MNYQNLKVMSKIVDDSRTQIIIMHKWRGWVKRKGMLLFRQPHNQIVRAARMKRSEGEINRGWKQENPSARNSFLQ